MGRLSTEDDSSTDGYWHEFAGEINSKPEFSQDTIGVLGCDGDCRHFRNRRYNVLKAKRLTAESVQQIGRIVS